MGKVVLPIAYQFTATEIAAGAANNLPKGTSIIIVDANSQPVDVKTAQGGGTPPVDSAGLKNNFAGTAVPLVTDDSSKGYSIGSRFIDTTNDESYICVDATLNNAVWSKSTVGIIAEVSGLQTALDAKADNTDLTDGSIQALLDTLRADSVHFLADATNIDNLTTTGWHNVNNATNGPAGGGWYYLFHGTHRNSATGAPTTNYGFQLAKRLNASATNNLLMRVQVNGSWTTWATLATIDAATTTVAGLMSAADKTKLDGVATGAEVNIQADWNQATTTEDSFINNKPTISALEGTTVPVMDGTAAVGNATTSSRSNHVHPSDTVKADNTDLTDSSINARFRTYLGSAVQFMASGTDLNTLAGVGWYNIQNPVNGPTTTTWYYVENIIHRTTSGEAVDSNYKFQRAITLTDTGVKEYSRISIANSWTAWVEIANIGDLATYAPLASPALTGTPTAPTATAGTNTTQLATTAFAMTAVAGRLTHISQGTLDANNTALIDNAVYTGTNTAAMTNAPTTAWAWALFNFRMGNWRTQIFIPAGGNIIYKRTVDGTFTGAVWQSVTFV